MSIELEDEEVTRKGIWEKVDHMFGPAPVCTACGQVPKADDGSGPLPAYNAVGVDVDWGNHLFICVRCADILAELHGCATAEATRKQRKQMQLLHRELAETKLKLEGQQDKIDKILAGSKAKKELKG